MLARMGRRYGGASGGKPCQDISDKFHRKRHRLRPDRDGLRLNVIADAEERLSHHLFRNEAKRKIVPIARDVDAHTQLDRKGSD